MSVLINMYARIGTVVADPRERVQKHVCQHWAKWLRMRVSVFINMSVNTGAAFADADERVVSGSIIRCARRRTKRTPL